MRGLLCGAVVVAFLGVSVSPAPGELITFGFSGEVTQVTDPGGVFGGAVIVGDPFTGSYTFESTIPDSYPADLTFGLYANAVTAATGTVGAIAFATDPSPRSYIRVVDGYRLRQTRGADYYTARAFVNVLTQQMELDLSLYRDDGSFLTSDALPTYPPQLPMLTANRVWILQEGGPSVGAQLTDLWLVPEPTTMALFALGLLLGTRRNRHNEGRL